MAKKIAVFIGQITQEYQTDMLEAVVQAAKEMGYCSDVFTEFGSYGDNYLHAEGELNIIHLPSLEEYQGIVIAPDTFGVTEMERKLDEMLLERAGGPVVSLRQKKNEFYSILVDNRSAERAMVEHLIRDKGFTNICFMRGKESLDDAVERYQGYLDAMAAHGLAVTEQMIFQGNYWRNKGDEAVEWFLKDGAKPEAIVCANDFMAISVLDALHKRGVEIPRDIAVVGFDDIEESKYVDPGLTSVKMPRKAMGREAVKLIKKLSEGEQCDKITYLPVELCLRGSSGSGEDEPGYWAQKLYGEKLYLSHVITQNSFMNADFENCDTIEELMYAAFLYSFHFAYDKLYICLCNHLDENGEKIHGVTDYSESMILRTVMRREGGYQMLEEKFERRNILPQQYIEKDGTYYMIPLHHKNNCLGYLVLETGKPDELKDFFQCWTWELSSYMDKIMLYEENQGLQQFRKLSLVDDLTGLYNRRKLDQELSKKLVSKKALGVVFYIVSLDMDGLKYINDTFGHLEGDVALKAFASILTACAGENDICCRVGGDEFIVLVAGSEEEDVKAYLQHVRDGISEYNAEVKKPYDLDGSAGYARYTRGEDLTLCMQQADSNMYANKMTKKHARK